MLHFLVISSYFGFVVYLQLSSTRGSCEIGNARQFTENSAPPFDLIVCMIHVQLRQSALEAISSSGDEREGAVQSSIEALEKIEEELKRRGKPFFGGETIGFLDLIAGFISYELPVFEEVASIKILDPSKFPAILNWIDNFLSHPMIKEGLPPKEEMIAYFEKSSKEVADRKASSKSG